MLSQEKVEKMKHANRVRYMAKEGEEDLGPFKMLPGKWSNTPHLPGRGWNLIALPSATSPFKYRVLMNQYNEELNFSTVDDNVPNRGLAPGGAVTDTDQFVVTLDYQQTIQQLIAAHFPPHPDPKEDEVLLGKFAEGAEKGGDIHHEPGLFLHMANKATATLDIARLGTIPHGDAVMALGSWAEDDSGTPPRFPSFNALPVGGPATPTAADLKQGPQGPGGLFSPYFNPYAQFEQNPFHGTVPAGTPGFPGFFPSETTLLLKEALNGLRIKKTTTLDFNTQFETSGIVNIPFIVNQANATAMHSIFWIHELNDADE